MGGFIVSRFAHEIMDWAHRVKLQRIGVPIRIYHSRVNAAWQPSSRDTLMPSARGKDAPKSLWP